MKRLSLCEHIFLIVENIYPHETFIFDACLNGRAQFAQKDFCCYFALKLNSITMQNN